MTAALLLCGGAGASASPAFTSPAFTSPASASPAFTSPASASPASASPAFALGPDCTNPPDGPTEGVGGMLDPGVAHPRGGDPFADDPKTTLYETYGWDGAGWVNYDLGCGPDAARDTTAVMFGNSANFGFGMLSTAASGTVSLFRAAVEPAAYTPALDSAIGDRITAATESLFVKVFALALLLMAILMMFRAHRGQLARAAGQTGTAVLLTFGAAAAIAWAASGGPLIDRALTISVNAAAESAAGITQGPTADLAAPDALGARLEEATVWQTWRAGAVGRNTSPAADEAAECMFASGNLTKAERAKIDAEPETWEEVWKGKQSRFDKCAEELKDADPRAYRYLAGHENLDRNWTVGIGWLAWFSVAPLTLVASLMLLLCTLVARIALWLFPILAAIALIPAARPTLRRVADFITSAFLNGVLFAFVAIIWTTGAVAIVANLSGGTAVLVLVLLTVLEFAFLFFLHPFRRLRQSVSVFGGYTPSLAKYHELADSADRSLDGAAAPADERSSTDVPGYVTDPDEVATVAAMAASRVGRTGPVPAAAYPAANDPLSDSALVDAQGRTVSASAAGSDAAAGGWGAASWPGWPSAGAGTAAGAITIGSSGALPAGTAGAAAVAGAAAAAGAARLGLGWPAAAGGPDGDEANGLGGHGLGANGAGANGAGTDGVLPGRALPALPGLPGEPVTAPSDDGRFASSDAGGIPLPRPVGADPARVGSALALAGGNAWAAGGGQGDMLDGFYVPGTARDSDPTAEWLSWKGDLE